MKMTERAKENHRRLFGTELPPLSQTDPEFAERLSNFLLDEVPAQSKLSDRTRMLAILAALLGCQGLDEFKRMLPAALNLGVTPVEVKETVYQATAYLGIGRTYPFLGAVNEILLSRGVSLPLEPQATTTLETGWRWANRPRWTSSANHERVCRVRPRRVEAHQPLALGQLLRRLLHPRRAELPGPGDDHLLLYRRPGRV